MMKSLKINVFGRVQNVGFRYYTHKKANETGIKGFVKNMIDGSVYIEAEGDENDLNHFTDWVRNGPRWSNVDNIQIQEQPLQEFQDFRVR